MEAEGRTVSRLAVGGRALVSEYEQTTEGDVTLRAHSVLRRVEEDDETEPHYVLHFFSEMSGAEPTVLRGGAEGGALVLEGPGPGGVMRQTIRYEDDRMTVVSASRSEDGEWSPTFRGSYRRESPAETGEGVDSGGPGTVGWRDLTVDDAPRVRDFYAAVVGWTAEAVEMDGYADFNMIPPGASTPVAGVCHARGPNADLPPRWMVYVEVENLDSAVETAVDDGGTVVVPVRSLGEWRMAVIRDPAGAELALVESG
jgi:hypothetical protein